MEIKVVGQAVVITSSIKKADLEKAQQLEPGLVILCDEEKSPLFAATFHKRERADISGYGIQFNTKNADGFCQATILVPEGVVPDKRIAWLKDTYGQALAKLVKLEAQFTEKFKAATAAIDAAFEGITTD
jgi:hypothetical protein